MQITNSFGWFSPTSLFNFIIMLTVYDSKCCLVSSSPSSSPLLLFPLTRGLKNTTDFSILGQLKRHFNPVKVVESKANKNTLGLEDASQ